MSATAPNVIAPCVAPGSLRVVPAPVDRDLPRGPPRTTLSLCAPGTATPRWRPFAGPSSILLILPPPGAAQPELGEPADTPKDRGRCRSLHAKHAGWRDMRRERSSPLVDFAARTIF